MRQRGHRRDRIARLHRGQIAPIVHGPRNRPRRIPAALPRQHHLAVVGDALRKSVVEFRIWLAELQVKDHRFGARLLQERQHRAIRVARQRPADLIRVFEPLQRRLVDQHQHGRPRRRGRRQVAHAPVPGLAFHGREKRRAAQTPRQRKRGQADEQHGEQTAVAFPVHGRERRRARGRGQGATGIAPPANAPTLAAGGAVAALFWILRVRDLAFQPPPFAPSIERRVRRVL